MKVITPLLRHAVYPLLAGAGYFRSLATRGEVCILTYHGVLPRGYSSTDPVLDGNLLSARAFRQQLRWLKTNFEVVAPGDFLSWLRRERDLPSRALLLTCDDGLLNHLTEMVPILREEALSCLFFVTKSSTSSSAGMLWYEQLYLMLMTAREDQAFEAFHLQARLGSKGQRRILWWELVKRLSRLESNARKGFVTDLGNKMDLSDNRRWIACFEERFHLLTRSDLDKLSEAGMTVGAHTLSHPVLAEQSDEAALVEILESRRALEADLGVPIWAFAYPFGDPASISARDITFAERAGFQCAFTNSRGGFGARLPRYSIPRVHVTSEMSFSELEAHICGFYRDLHRPAIGWREMQSIKRPSAPV
jgi:peptidoglycan/xylan/chitin deacetylase (PgdA/CDA1 family)